MRRVAGAVAVANVANEGVVLLDEGHQPAVGAGPCRAPGVVEQHEREHTWFPVFTIVPHPESPPLQPSLRWHAPSLARTPTQRLGRCWREPTATCRSVC